MDVRVGTWNVQYGQGAERNRLRHDLLVRYDADVWVLTETNDSLDLSEGYEAVHSAPRFRPETRGRWVTVWTRLPIARRHRTDDADRSVAVSVATRDGGTLTVFGTVLPWQYDVGPDPTSRAPAWAEFYRVTPLQAKEWQRLRTEAPHAMLIVAGDLNHNLGGPHYCGTRRGREVLRAGLATASLTCLTEYENFPTGTLAHPPIDHVCAAPPEGQTLEANVTGWEKGGPSGAVLSDHSGVVAHLRSTS